MKLVRASLGFVLFGCCLAVACERTEAIPDTDDAGADGSSTTDGSVTGSDGGALIDSAAPDGALRDATPADADSRDADSRDGEIEDGSATTDATTASDGSADATSDAASDAGGPSVVLGADGVVRGTVSGSIVHKWNGSMVATNPSCPAGSTVTNGCCVWDGTFQTLDVVEIPIVFDLATRSGTLAGSPIGPFGVGPTEPDGTVVYQSNPSSRQFENHWPAMEAIGARTPELAATLAASMTFKALDIATPVIFSTSYARVRWNAATSLVQLIESHVLQRKLGGANANCGLGSGGQSSWTLKSR